ncbi:MAG: hypothetical protein AAB719_02280 [Patescibacteria group bacterium]
MNKERKCEIGYLLLKQQLRRDGLLLNGPFKEQLDRAASTLGIPPQEVEEFAVLITRDVSESTDAAPG